MAFGSIHSCHSTRIKLNLLDQLQFFVGAKSYISRARTMTAWAAISPPKIHSFVVLDLYMFNCECRMH